MNLLTVGAAALNQTPLDWDGNRAHIVAAIREGRARGVSVLCLPELCISGYGCEDAFLSPGLQRMALDVLREIVPETEGLVVSIGLPLRYQSGLFNTACLLADGRILGFTAKQFLASEGLHYEPRWFRPWPAGRRGTITLEGVEYPIGDVHYRCGDLGIGLEICEDAWAAGRPGAALSRFGVDIILNPSASHFAFGKYALRQRLVAESSRALGVTYVYSNLLGNEAGRAIYGGEVLIASGGEMVALGRRFRFVDVELTTAVIDVDRGRMARARVGSFAPGAAEEGACVEVPFQYAAAPLRRSPLSVEGWEQSAWLKEEEFARAVALALLDYLRKSRTRGFVVSLSGGADSSAVACLVALMVRLGCRDAGAEGFRRRLAEVIDLPGGGGERALVRALLTCVYQATVNSSQATKHAARTICAAIGADYLEIDVEPIVRAYVDLISQALGRKLSWEGDDLALQNVQARARSPGVWMIANLRGALLLSTSNRSEAAVGYATMDGDTSGGLSPIAGIDKAFLRRWLAWLEKTGPQGGEPIPELAVVNALTPTAELRPLQAAQTDEEDLMPYDLLDAIERAAIRDKKTPREVYELMRVAFPEYAIRQLVEWVERFFKLWCRNQWKRERYAPSFHLDDENLDPKTWCRFPILCGGFERELRELWEVREVREALVQQRPGGTVAQVARDARP